MIVFALLAVFALGETPNPPGEPVYKIVTRHTFSSRHNTQTSTSTTTDWYSGSKHRSDSRSEVRLRSPITGADRATRGPNVAYVTDCVAQHMLQINFDDHTYAEQKLPPQPTLAELKARAAKMPKPVSPIAPKVTVEMNVTDTGERKDFFGFEAHHYLTERKTIPHTDSARLPQESTSDGWYIDFHPNDPCQPPWLQEMRREGKAVVSYLDAGPFEQAEFKHHGPAVSGYAVKIVNTNRYRSKMPDGTIREFTARDEIEVVELSRLPYDETLFQPPVGFKKVDQIKTDPDLPLTMRAAIWLINVERRIAGLFR